MRDPFLWPYSVWIHNCCGGANINLIFTPLFVIWCFIKINVSYSTGVPLPTADALPLNWLICPVFTSFLSNIFKHSAFSGTFQRTGLHSVYAEQTPQWGKKWYLTEGSWPFRKYHSRMWQKDTLARCVHVQAGSTAAPHTPIVTEIIGLSRTMTARRHQLVKSF